MRRLTLTATLLVTLATAPALAALTPSEKAVIRTFIEKAELTTSQRVRVLVARPDLSAEEVADAVRAGLAGSSFDERHERFTEALLFGPGSAASRNTLVPAVVEGLLARAATRMGEVPIEPVAHPGKRARAAVLEVLRIHAFIDARIANAGHPPPEGHDPGASIRDDALRGCLAAYRTHLQTHERWLRPPGPLSAELVRVRAQMAVTFVDLGRGVVGRSELAQGLGFSGARAEALTRLGVVVEPGAAPEARTLAAVRLLASVPQASSGLGLWLLGKVSPAGLVARGRIARAGAVLQDTPRPLRPEALWSDRVAPSRPDGALATVAESVADLAVARTFAERADLADRAQGAAHRALQAGEFGLLSVAVSRRSLAREGAPAAPPAPAAIVAGALTLLLLDAPRAIDLAAIAAGQGRAEPLEQLALALTVLAGGGKTATAGVTLPTGLVDSVTLSDIQSADGLVSRFTLGGRVHALAHDAAGGFTLTLDGAPPRLTALSSFVVRPTAGESWQASGTEYTRVNGAPRVAALDDGRVVVEGSKGGYDAIATGAEVMDVEVTARVRSSGPGGTVLVRARAGETAFAGVGLAIEPDPPRARLLMFDGRGKAFQMAEPVVLPEAPEGGHLVTLRVEGQKLTARVGDRTLEGTLAAEGAVAGRAGFAVRAGGELELRDVTVGPPGSGKGRSSGKAGGKAPGKASRNKP